MSSHRKIDIIGKKFGMLVVISVAYREGSSRTFWLCKCECGREKVLRGDSLKDGNTRSCGCINNQYIKRDVSGFAPGLWNTKFYRTWYHIQGRCYNKNNVKYNNYGGRNIQCEWGSFKEFYDDMYDEFLQHVEKEGERQTSIDRINNNGNYSKENCQWATYKIQANNKRNNRRLHILVVEKDI